MKCCSCFTAFGIQLTHTRIIILTNTHDKSSFPFRMLLITDSFVSHPFKKIIDFKILISSDWNRSDSADECIYKRTDF